MKELRQSPLYENAKEVPDVKVFSKFTDVFNFVLIWTLLTSAYPFTFFVAVPNHPYKFLIFVGLAFCIFILLLKSKIKIPNKTLVGILIAQILFFALPFSLLHSSLTGEINGDGYITLSIQYIAVLITYIYVSNCYSISKVTKSYIYVLLFMAFLGWIAFLLGWLGLINIISIHQNPDSRTAFNFGLTFSNTIVSYGNSFLIRVAGFFDEPGTFAYFLTFALVINRIYGFSRKIEIFLILGGVPTLSLAYFISVGAYLILFYANYRNFKYFLIFMLSIFFLVSYVDQNKNRSDLDSQIYSMTLGRLEAGEDTQLFRGDNRTDVFRIASEAFEASPIIGQGIRYRENSESDYAGVFLGANIMSPLAIHGILGSIFIFLPFIYWSYLIFFSVTKYTFKEVLVSCWLIIALNLLQRPDLVGFLNVFVTILLIELFFLKKDLARN